jgi:glycosyltransferase involved in cell wall biosynthesis
MSVAHRSLRNIEISVVVASSFRRELTITLESIKDSADHAGARCEVIVVVNGTERDKQFAFPSLPRVRYVVLQHAGKSRALNRGISEAKGELIAFTDDDVVVSREWLRGLWDSARRYQHEYLFCGPITPVFPDDTPEWLKRHRFAAMLFADFRPAVQEGVLPKGILPFGPNMAVRRAAAKAVEFRLDLGPSAENGSLFGEDTVYASEIVARFGIFGRCSGAVFVPEAAVLHCQDAERFQKEALYTRCFDIGRTRAVLRGGVSHLVCHPVLTRSLQMMRSDSEAFTDSAEINFYCGQAAAFRAMMQRDAVDFLIGGLAIHGDPAVDASLCTPARRLWCEERTKGARR